MDKQIASLVSNRTMSTFRCLLLMLLFCGMDNVHSFMDSLKHCCPLTLPTPPQIPEIPEIPKFTFPLADPFASMESHQYLPRDPTDFNWNWDWKPTEPPVSSHNPLADYWTFAVSPINCCPSYSTSALPTRSRPSRPTKLKVQSLGSWIIIRSTTSTSPRTTTSTSPRTTTSTSPRTTTSTSPRTTTSTSPRPTTSTSPRTTTSTSPRTTTSTSPRTTTSTSPRTTTSTSPRTTTSTSPTTTTSISPRSPISTPPFEGTTEPPNGRNELNRKQKFMDMAKNVCLVGVGVCLVVMVVFFFKERRRRVASVQEAKQKLFRQWTKQIIVEKPQSQDNLQMPLIPTGRIENQTVSRVESQASLAEYEIPNHVRWEFPREQLKLGKILGQGNFGKVMMAQALSILPGKDITTVAVKMLKDNHSDFDEANLVQEMEIMKMIRKHVNVLSMLGCCTHNGPLYMILEYAPHGNLRDFLRLHQLVPGYGSVIHTNGTNSKNVSQTDLISFAHQIARGMEYLASRRFVHRDLAARNILVSDNYVMKIADFGLARDIRRTNYYFQKSGGQLPVKWMAPETLIHKKYSSRSDVWSFGILLWEIMTLGRNPYPSFTSVGNLLNLHQSGHRMEKPPECSLRVYKIMRDCWSYGPIDRPTFSDLVIQLDAILTRDMSQDYIRFGTSPLITPQSSFEGSNYDDQQNYTRENECYQPLVN